MVNSKELQVAYNKLYKRVREYIWPFSAVETIASLEEATYRAMPNLQEVQMYLNRLRYDAGDILREDEDFKLALDGFQKLLDDGDTSFMKLTQTREVISL